MKFNTVFLFTALATLSFAVAGLTSHALNSVGKTRIGTSVDVPIDKHIILYWTPNSVNDISGVMFNIELTNNQRVRCSTDTEPEYLIKLDRSEGQFYCIISVPNGVSVKSVQGGANINTLAEHVAINGYRNIGQNTENSLTIEGISLD